MKLGIKGNENRGDEIIKILEMLGGKNRHEMRGSIYDKYFYYIDDEYKDISYSYIGPDEIKGYKIFSLEDFLEKYPYKVGDKVNIYVQNDDIEGWFDIEVAEITSMRWDPVRCRIVYKMEDIDREFCVEDIKGKVDDKTNKDMEEKKINQMSLANCDLDEVEIVLGDRFELKIENGKYYAVRKKPTYPTNYDECCQYLGCDDKIKMKLIGQFTRLINARNAYWKIAGEQMGLGKPWEPDWNEPKPKYTIAVIENKLVKHYALTQHCILAFPTEEIREVFHKNFKDLIEQCKELL